MSHHWVFSVGPESQSSPAFINVLSHVKIFIPAEKILNKVLLHTFTYENWNGDQSLDNIRVLERVDSLKKFYCLISFKHLITPEIKKLSTSSPPHKVQFLHHRESRVINNQKSEIKQYTISYRCYQRSYSVRCGD